MDLLWALVNSYGYGSNSLSALWIVLVIVLALILGPLAESNLRRSLLLSQGSASIFFTRPICIFFLLLAFVLYFFFGISCILIVLISGLLGWLLCFWRARKGGFHDPS